MLEVDRHRTWRVLSPVDIAGQDLVRRQLVALWQGPVNLGRRPQLTGDGLGLDDLASSVVVNIADHLLPLFSRGGFIRATLITAIRRRWMTALTGVIRTSGTGTSGSTGRGTAVRTRRRRTLTTLADLGVRPTAGVTALLAPPVLRFGRLGRLGWLRWLALVLGDHDRVTPSALDQVALLQATRFDQMPTRWDLGAQLLPVARSAGDRVADDRCDRLSGGLINQVQGPGDTDRRVDDIDRRVVRQVGLGDRPLLSYISIDGWGRDRLDRPGLPFAIRNGVVDQVQGRTPVQGGGLLDQLGQGLPRGVDKVDRPRHGLGRDRSLWPVTWHRLARF